MIYKTFGMFVVLFASACTFTYEAYGENYYDIFARGNDYYTQGEFESARFEYEKILDMGFASAELFFNLGNNYYKLGKIGSARLYYEKALKIRPRDKDIKSNLNFLKSGMGTGSAQIQTSDIILDSILEFFSINEITVIMLFFWFAFFGIITAELFVKNFILSLAKMVVLCLAVVAGVWWYGIYDRQVRRSYAVILEGQAQVYGGPGVNFSVGFTAPEGEKALVLKEFDGWFEIGIKSEGLRGWIKKGQAGII